MNWADGGLLCPECESIFDPRPVMRCGRDVRSGRALVEITCTTCGSLLYREVDPGDAWRLLWAGAQAPTESFPFELLEVHEGPPISEADVDRFVSQLERTPSRRGPTG